MAESSSLQNDLQRMAFDMRSPEWEVLDEGREQVAKGAAGGHRIAGDGNQRGSCQNSNKSPLRLDRAF